MKILKQIKKVSVLLLLLSFLSATAFAQTVYVSATNGNDAYSGENASNNPFGTGPKATITAGMATLPAAGGTIVITGDTYAGASETLVGGRLQITKDIVFDAIRLPASFTVVNLPYPLEFDSDVVVSFVSNDGTATFQSDASGTSMLFGDGSAVNISGASLFELTNNSTLEFDEDGALTGNAPAIAGAGQVSLLYTGALDVTAGPESNYGDYVAGTITVNKAAAGDVVTFPNDIQFSGAPGNAIVVTAGGATFSGDLDLGLNNVVNNGTGLVTIGSGVADALDFNGAAGAAGQLVSSATGNFVVNATTTWQSADGAAVNTTVIDGSAGASDFTFNAPVVFATDAGNAGNATGISIDVVGGGDLTFNGAVSAPASADGDVSQVDVANGAGDMVFAAGAELLGPGTTVDNSNAGTATFSGATDIATDVDNSGGGTLTFNGTTTVGGDYDNSAASTSTFNGTTTISGDLTNTGSDLVVNGATEVTGALTNGAGGDVQWNAASEIGAVVSNNTGTSTMTFNNVTVELSGTGASGIHLTNGGTVTVVGAGKFNVTGAAVSFNGGDLPGLLIDAGSTTGIITNAADVKGDVTVNGNLNVAIATDVTASGSTFAINAGGTVTPAAAVILTVNNYTQSGGTLDLNTNNSTIAVEGDFLKTGGTLLGNNQGTIDLSGTTAQSFNPGSLLDIYDLTISNTTSGVTFQNSVRVANDCDIQGGNHVLSTFNIYMNGAAGTITNDGTYTATGGGGIIFTANGTTIQGTGVYSNITTNIAAGGGAITTGSDVYFTGLLTLFDGGVTVAAGDDFGPSGNVAKVVRNIEETDTDVDVTTNAGATWNTNSPVEYDLEYNGTLTANRTIAAELDAAAAGKTRDLTVNTSGAFTVSLLANAYTIQGDLSVVSAATLAIVGGADLTLAKNSGAHVVAGRVTSAGAGDELIVEGNNATLFGSTTANDPAEVGNLVIDATGVTVSNLETINGTFETAANATVTLGLTNLNTGGANGDEEAIVGAVTLGGDALTLTTDIEAQAGVAHNKGSVAFGDNDLDVTAGNFVRAADASAVYTAGSGALILSNAGMTFNLANGTIPNVDFDVNVTLGGHATVSVLADHNAGTITSAGFDVTIENLMETVGGNIMTGAGELILAGTTVELAANGNVDNLTINSTGTANITSNSATVRTLTINNAFDQIAGNVSQGANHIEVDGTFDWTAGGTWSQTTGYLILNNGGATFTPDGLPVDNFEVQSALTTTEPWEVRENLVMTGGVITFDDGELTIGDGALITRVAGSFTTVPNPDPKPTFGATVNVTINSAGVNSGEELPDNASVLQNLIVDGTGAYDLTKDIQVNNKLTVDQLLSSNTANPNHEVVTMADNTTVEMQANADIEEVLNPLGGLNLIYNGVAATDSEEWATGFTISSVDIQAPTNLHANRTIAGTLNVNGGDFNLATFTLTTQGSVTLDIAGGLDEVTNGSLVFGGTSNTTLNLNAEWNIPASLAFTLNKGDDENYVSLLGGNLDFAANMVNLVFQNGLLVTGTVSGQGAFVNNDLIVKLFHDDDGLTPLQGFNRTAVDPTAGERSHIVGNVQKYLDATGNFYGNTPSIALTRVEFPTGTLPASPGNYRPMAFQFNSTTLPTANFNLTVTHEDSDPMGDNGFPIAATDNLGNPMSITNYPDFYWLVKSDLTLQPQVKFDIEAQAEGYVDYVDDEIENVRFIRRFDNNVENEWLLQGSTGYDNAANGDIPVVIAKDAEGAISTQGARFTYSQNNKAPYFTSTLANVAHPTIPGAVIGGAVAATEGTALTGTYAVTDPDLNQTATMFLVEKPDSATFNATTGAFAWTPDNTTAPGPYNVSIGSTDGVDTTIVTDVITVTDVNQNPYFTAAPAATVNVGEGAEYNFTYTAADDDADNTSLTYSIQALTGTAPDSISLNTATGALVIIPAFGQVGDQFDLTVRVTDGAGGTADTLSSFTVTDVNRAPSFTAEMPDTTVNENQALAFTYTATDPDAGDNLTFSLGAAAPAGATIDANTGAFAWTPAYTQAGVHTFKVWVTDDGTPNMSDSSEVTVTVLDVNSPPAFTAVLPDTTIFVGDKLTFTYVAEDLDLDALSFTLDVPNPQTLSIVASDDTSATIEWTPVVTDTAMYLIGMTVSDGQATDYTQAVVIVEVTTVDINGVVSYNVSAELLDAVTVTLSDGVNQWTDVTDATGAYSFTDVMSGEYTITAAKTTQWGGALASDALETQLYVVNPDSTFLATDLQKTAADVVGVGNITSSDALAILNRSVGIDDFQIDDWQFETATVTAGTQDLTQNLMGIAAGDARSDYSPMLGLAKASSISVNSDEVLNIKKESEFELPISIAELTEIGSFTFKLKYDVEKVEFLGVSTDINGTLVANVVEDVISIAWVNLSSKEINVKDGAALATLKFKATDKFSKADEVSLELLDGAEMTDRLAKNINAGINIPVVAIGIPDVFALRQNYPNPFNPSTTIQYDLPENGKVTLTVYNSLGQRVGTLVNTKQVAGAYEVNFNASNLASGVYLYRVTVEGTKNFVMTKKMILMK